MVTAAPSAPEPASPSGAPAPLSAGYARYALGLLLVVYVFNFVDRTILTILLPLIKKDLNLSDTALGFLSGIAFALFYSTLGIPIARWADRGSRRTIIAIACFLWSLMTAVTGLAQSFVQLALARVGVGVGEAGCSPPAHALLSDYFPPARRGTALAIYALGIPIGASIGNLAGGWLGQLAGWRLTFLFVGIPGVLLAIAVRLTLREPHRGASEGLGDGPPGAHAESAGEVMRFLARQRSFLHMSLAAALHSLYGYGAGAFIALFMVEVHHFSLGELGTWLAGIGILGGGLGTYLGGRTSDWMSGRDNRWYMWVPALATLGAIPFAFLFYLWPDGRVALILSIPGSIAGAMWLGPTFAMTQTLVRPHMRATASAILLLVINLIGMGLGPQIVGIASDLLRPSLGSDAIRYAILGVVATCALWSALHYWLASRTLLTDLQAKEGGTAR